MRKGRRGGWWEGGWREREGGKEGRAELKEGGVGGRGSDVLQYHITCDHEPVFIDQPV